VQCLEKVKSAIKGKRVELFHVGKLFKNFVGDVLKAEEVSERISDWAFEELREA